jgi:uncharacterized paraquat-inducible protein A
MQDRNPLPLLWANSAAVGWRWLDQKTSPNQRSCYENNQSHAILAYTCKDTFHNKYHMIDQITCPHCESSIEVPTNESLRTPCDTPPDAD